MGAFDYGQKSAQQKVALVVKDTTARFISPNIVGPKQYPLNPTAGVMTKVLSVNGSGAINFAAIQAQSSSGAMTMKLRITLDGRVIYNGSASISANSYYGIVGVGAAGSDPTNSVSTTTLQRIPFDKSLLVEYSNSHATDSVNVWVDYEVNV